MAFITISTIYQTIFVAIFLLISKGWVIIHSTLSRQQATAVTMLMGVVYLSYSAYYVVIDVESIKSLIDLTINLIYILLTYLILRNCIKVLAVLNFHLRMLNEGDFFNLHDSLILKIKLIKRFMFIAFMFFTFELVAHGLIPLTKV